MTEPVIRDQAEQERMRLYAAVEDAHADERRKVLEELREKFTAEDLGWIDYSSGLGENSPKVVYLHYVIGCLDELIAKLRGEP